MNVTSSLVILFSVVESSWALILTPCPGAEGRRVLARARLSCPVRNESLGDRLAYPSRLIAGRGDCILTLCRVFCSCILAAFFPVF